MSRQIFVNLPVEDLNRSIGFFRKLGFEFNPQFTDQNATCMIIGDNIFAMLLVKKFFKTFIKKEIANAHKDTEVMLAISAHNKKEVDELIEKALHAGGKEPRPAQDHGWMYGRSFEDLDGHIWELFHMDMSAMPQNPVSNAATSKNEFVISRTLDAPKNKVWKAFSDPEEMKHWWGPKGAKVMSSKMDFRVGGTYHYGMEYNDQEVWGKFVYREIHPHEKMVLVSSFSDEKGGITKHPMSPTWPLEMLSTFTFEEHGGKTKLTIKWVPINPTAEERKTFEDGYESMVQGWTGTFEQLEEYLKR